MLLGTGFDDAWKNYCRLCEWECGCCEDAVCPYFTPQEWLEFEVAEIVDDQDMRQAEYLMVVAEYGGGD